MTKKSGIFAAMAALAIVLPFVGLLASPAAAAGNSTIVVTAVATSSTYPGAANATAVVTGDGTPPAGGSLTYSFFAGSGSCSGTAATQTVQLNADGTVPDSQTEGSLGAGTDSFEATYNGDIAGGGTNDPSAMSTCESVIIGQATPTPPTISNLPASGTFGGNFTATVNTNADGTTSVVSNSTGICTVGASEVVSFVGGGTCSLTAEVSAGTNYASSTGSAQTFSIGQATPTTPTISNLPASGTFGGNFVASVQTNGDGTTSVVSNSTGICTVDAAQKVTFVGAGSCSLTAQVSAGTNYASAVGAAQTLAVGQAPLPAGPTITNLPTGGTFGGSFVAELNASYGSLNGVGTQSVTSNTPTVCSTSGLAVSYVGVGTCSLNAQVATGANYLAASGSAQTLTIGRATPTTPTITNIPAPANEFFGFTPNVGTTGDGTQTVTSSTPKVCSVGSNGLTVTFVGFGTCTLTPSVAQGTNYFGATGSAQSFTVQEASHGYWLVGSDGGIFSFGTAAFHGSMGSTPLQRPVVAITPTLTGNGYWLVASDGGIFSFGDSTYYGSLPQLGFHPFASGQTQSLNAPIVGMVPTFTGRGYFMVASDGGVFAFGDAKFKGSCPGIGGCAGAAVSVMPDRTGDGYWLVTSLGNVYAFGDAPYYGGPTPSTVPVVDAVATPDGHGYWLLYANGVVATFGDATNLGAPVGYVNGFNPATAIFPTVDGQGYWVASGRGDVFSYGVSPYLGSEAAAGLNGEIIAAFGF